MLKPNYLRFSILILLFMAGFASASSVRLVDMAEISRDAQLVFEGRVIGSRIEHQPGEKAIHTWVKFEVLDVIKGDYSNPVIELSFLGGAKGNLRVSVSDMEIPKMGEHGIYFVEDPQRSLVNPLVGWAQGHFLVQYDRKLKRQKITTLQGKPVFDIDTRLRGQAMAEISEGVARGVITRPYTHGDRPLEPMQFKSLIMEMAQ